MKNWKTSIWIKLFLVLLSTVSLLVVMASALVLVYKESTNIYDNTNEDIYGLNEQYNGITSYYAVKAMDNKAKKNPTEAFEKTNFRYGIVELPEQMTKDTTVDWTKKDSYLVENFDAMPTEEDIKDGKYKIVYFWQPEEYSYDGNLLSLYAGYYCQEDSYISPGAYAYEGEKLGSYLYERFGEETPVELTDEEKMQMQDNTDDAQVTEITVDSSEGNVSNEKQLKSYVVLCSVCDPLIKNSEGNNSMLTGDLYQQYTTVYNKVVALGIWPMVVLIVAAIVMIATLVLLVLAAGHRLVKMEEDDENENLPEKKEEICAGFWQKVFWEIDFITFVGVEGLLIAAVLYCVEIGGITIDTILGATSIMVIAYWIGIAWLMNVAIRFKCGKWYRCSIIYAFFHWIVSEIKKHVQNISDSVKESEKREKQIYIFYGILSFLEFFAIAVTGCRTDVEVFLWIVYKVIITIVLVHVIRDWMTLKKGAKKIANGDMEQAIDTSKMYFGMKSHGEDLNEIKNGIEAAVEKRMQSERFKTELITNVSHDIKTPLTSIVNYVDLLEKEEIAGENAKEYIAVLSRQSERLKKLIEDLIEASKASTGNLPVNKTDIELGVFLTQTLGEYEEKLAQKGLTLITNTSERECHIAADGRHLWRIVDNIMNNVCKYAQPQTRVYIDLKSDENKAVISVKNTSKYQLNISGEELMERFVRGDSSRNTEGSGLGLSIAKSLMELMGGTLEIFVDGDFFKVNLVFLK